VYNDVCLIKHFYIIVDDVDLDFIALFQDRELKKEYKYG